MSIMENKTRETLIILQEECAEVIQATSKIFRFGFESCYPTEDSPTTKECLTMELGQLLCMVALLVDQKVVDETDMLLAMEAKKIKLEKWSSIFKDAS
jgi:NTP pyrophosphatase (non-canonical NTP hydrolase)